MRNPLSSYLPVISATINPKYNSPKSFRVGGALIVTNSTLVCDFCQFNGNTANVGGAIFSQHVTHPLAPTMPGTVTTASAWGE